MPKSRKAEDDRRNTSLRLSARKLKALKVRAVEEDTSVQKIIEALIDDYLGKAGK